MWLRSKALLVLVSLGLLACDADEAPSPAPQSKSQSATLLPLGNNDWPEVDFVAERSISILSSATVSGDVAVVGQAPDIFGIEGIELSLGRDARLQGSVWADSIYLSRGSELAGDVSLNALTGPGTFTGTPTTPLEIPLPLTLPEVPAITPGSADITVGRGVTQTLATGHYRDVKVRRGGSSSATLLRLSGGVYHMSSLTIDRDGRVECLAPCQLLVAGRVRLNTGGRLVPADGVLPSEVRVVSHEETESNGFPWLTPQGVQLSRDSRTEAYLYAPTATISLARGAEFLGRMVARDLILSANTEISACSTADTSCDGQDDDCDGAIDEDYVPSALTCGTGVCAGVGQTACVGGVVVEQCQVGDPTSGSDATCDGLDEDCDGAIDEDYLPTTSGCGTGVCAAVGDTACIDGVVQSGCVPLPPVSESDASCDGLDQDCSGEADEDYVAVALACGAGACGAIGATECSQGVVVEACTPGSPQGDDDNCNGIDDDCDGAVDEDYVPSATSCGVGACSATGVASCVGGQIVDTCSAGQPAAQDSTCDGVDDNCNGSIDEEFVSQQTSCGVGVCSATGITSCVSGAIVDTCSAGDGDTVDTTCDGVDDDCDGEVDEDYLPVATLCGEGECQASGATACLNAQEVDSCEPGNAANEDATCDGIDNDCDGAVDEDFQAYSSVCGVGACQQVAAVSCAGGVETDLCEPLPPATSDATCDGIDNDCDGQTDEGYVSEVTSCGQGACGSTGQTSCEAGQVEDSCSAGSPSATDASCDGVDDDCDGEVDEDYAVQSTTCGLGACGATGQLRCLSGNPVDSCTPSLPATLDASCNGIDDDCDGAIDEDYLSVTSSCGTGACAATGSTLCLDGQEQNNCVEGEPQPSDSSCDGVDDDCDGLVDEEFVGQASSCGVGACVSTGSTACVSGNVENSCRAGTPTVGDFACDGIDEDCDGAVDEDFIGEPTVCGVGACLSSGTTTCFEGQEQDTCLPGVSSANDESCDGVDNDCDGETDEDYLETETSCGSGACGQTGVLSCNSGAVSNSCEPSAPAASDATCDGVDDDCDGLIDEDFEPIATACGVGACSATGLSVCQLGTVVDNCEAGTSAMTDATCDGVDDDCDGQIDEDYDPQVTSCGVGVCASAGATACESGVEVDSCSPGQASAADTICDGLDNDCDGQIDEDFVTQSSQCGSGACGATGVSVCEDGTVVDSCVPGSPAADDASCDGVDDDCDGLIDEDYAPEAVSCGVGVCAAVGSLNCESGQLVNSCTPGQGDIVDTTCDGVDDDCDGSVDEDYLPLSTSCGAGACAQVGATACVDGGEVDSCEVGNSAAEDSTCDGLDNDCDGLIDEDFVPSSTSCGTGACGAEGITSCVAGIEADSCVAGSPLENDSSCNAQDDDCDGEVDEDFAPQTTTCGVGACGSSSLNACVDGTIIDQCVPGTAAGTDASCNAIDDDCDGLVDEDYLTQPVDCGVGACARSGSTSCQSGSVVSECEPGEPAADDQLCDGIDGDCDGQVDEDYVSASTSCGVGACTASGVRECSQGVESDSCLELAPLGIDSTCDGVDDDCDGETDEEFATEALSCGQGVCQANGTTSCVAGAVQNSCEPGEPLGIDNTCDGLDDDCDGFVDEDFESQTTSCGFGACAATGATSCSSGIFSDSCSSLEPALDDYLCNGVDDDCDGLIDEDYSPTLTSCGVGLCMSAGQTECVGGTTQNTCEAGDPLATDSTCDGIDDDCDGLIDEDFVASAVSCGVGACAATGTTECNGGIVENICQPGSASAVDSGCNGIDDDCDGEVDEDYVPQPTSCGVGACAATGSTACVLGVVSDECVPGEAAASDVDCDGIDDNCNGEADEGFVGASVQCGVGACVASGVSACLAGVESEQCTPGEPATADATCDGIDDNCNGEVDEDFVSGPNTCGVGECASTGSATCVAGAIQSTCTPGEPAVADTLCDGRDEDCDGSVDEDFVGAAVSCGLGECQAQGTTSCVAGELAEQCVPGAPTGLDDNCNGRDENCDGQADDAYEPEVLTCGTGACARTTSSECLGGVESRECEAGFPAMDDSACDGIDEDCDGAVDEDFAGGVTTCGIGACASTGSRICDAGTVTDSCAEGTPAANDVTCNGTDDDCDGNVDEDFVASCSGSSVQSCVDGGVRFEQCSDNDACNGAEACSSAACTSGTPPVLDDGNQCTVGSCDAILGVMQSPAAMGTPCGGGNVCNGLGACVELPTITQQPQDLDVVVGQPFSLVVVAEGGQLTYQWYRNGVAVPGATQRQFTILSGQLDDDGSAYSVTVANSAGSVTSRNAVVRIGDSLGPALELITASQVEVASDPFHITGTATDSGSGVSLVWIENERLPGIQIAATWDLASGEFSADVPLSPGINLLTVSASDQSGNTTTSQVVATLVLSSVPRIEILSPVNGSAVNGDRVDVIGLVRTSLKGSQLQIQLGGRTAFPTGTTGEYDFVFEDVNLTRGRNELTVRVVTSEGTTSLPFVIYSGVDQGEVAGKPPAISLANVAPIVHATSDKHIVSGTVTAESCVSLLLVNGQSIQPQGTGGFVSFGVQLTVPPDGTQFPVVVRAVDCLGRSSQVEYAVVYDATAPVVALSAAIAPQINLAQSTPYTLSASIYEPNLAGISVGSQSIGAVPTGNDNWEFEVALPLAVGVDRSVNVVIWDKAGNSYRETVLIALDATLEVEWLSPKNGDSIVSLEDPTGVSVAVRVPGMAAGDTVVARLDAGEAVTLGGAGEVRRGQFAVTLANAQHSASARVVGADGTVKVESTVQFSVKDAETIEVSMVGISPSRGARSVEINEPIEVAFNRPIDSSKLRFEVTESGQATIYEEASAGADVRQVSEVKMIDVTKNGEPVIGSLSAILGDTSFIFYPQQDYLYTGTVSVSVLYEDEEVGRGNFQIRDVPTVLDGIVMDSAGDPLIGIEVSLPGAGRSAQTDPEGYFSFGSGSIDNKIPGGRQLLKINGGNGNRRVGTFEMFVNPQAGYLSSLGLLRLPLQDLSEPYRLVSSAAETLFLGGELRLDLRGASVLFPQGSNSGTMHAQGFLIQEFQPPSSGSVMAPFGFSLEPHGVEVSGDVAISFTLPERPGYRDYRELFPALALLVGVDSASLSLVPVGVAEVDPETWLVESRGPVALERLDYIGLALAPGEAMPLLIQYSRGQISLQQLRAGLLPN